MKVEHHLLAENKPHVHSIRYPIIVKNNVKIIIPHSLSICMHVDIIHVTMKMQEYFVWPLAVIIGFLIPLSICHREIKKTLA